MAKKLNQLEFFRFAEPTRSRDGWGIENTDIVHIGGVACEYLTFASVCGIVDPMQAQIPTLDKPTCPGCLGMYKMLKNGKI